LDIFFAVTAPGLEPFTALELSRLFSNIAPAPESGGVTFKGGLPELYRANLHLRTASRILARLGMPFLARDFTELEQKSARLPWERFIAPGQPVVLRVTCHKSKLYHSEAVAGHVLNAIAEHMGRPSSRLKPDDETGDPPQLVVVRLADDRCTVSVDSTGELLHRRGYRLASAKAPLRETLAAAIVMASGWDRQSPLLDPFCGSGTIPIEAALMALGVPPGIKRRFAFMDWPGFDKTLWQAIQGQSSVVHGPPPSMLASDRDAGAIKMAQENAARAGVDGFIEFSCRAVSSIEPPPVLGWVVTNPPYGRRVSEGRDLRNLYAQLGNVLREKCPGWQAAILCSDPALLGQMRLGLDTTLEFFNGGLQVRLGRGQVDKN
jgi:putative N6-adenine-specific DNA methylase